MDEIKRRANEYFLEFEGRHLYPKLLSWYWAAWLLSAIAFGYTADRALIREMPRTPQPWITLMFLAEFIFLGMASLIDQQKRKRIHECAPKSGAARKAFMDNKRRTTLMRICGIDTSKFAAAAKECADLMATQKHFPMESDTSLGEIFRQIYDRDSKARILTLFLALVATFVALLNHSLAPEDFNVLNTVADPGTMRLFVLVMSLTVVAFGAWIGLRLFGRFLADTAESIWAISLGSRRGTTRSLNYFVRDLIRLHQPARDDAQPGEAQLVEGVPPAPEMQEDVLAATLRRASADTRDAQRV